MRKFVAITAIMLPAVLLLQIWGNIPVSSAYATQNPIKSSPKPTPIPSFSTGEPTLCTQVEPAYTSSSLSIALKRSKGLMTTEVTATKIDGSESFIDIPIVTPNPTLITEVKAASAPGAILTDATMLTPTPSAGSSGTLNADILFSIVNQKRVNAGLAPFEKHPDVCSVAQSRGPELDNEIYGSSYMHAGFQAKQLPYYATENMISQQTEELALNWWLNSPVHRSAIMGDYTYACTVCQGRSCAMIFSNLTPKSI